MEAYMYQISKGELKVILGDIFTTTKVVEAKLSRLRNSTIEITKSKPEVKINLDLAYQSLYDLQNRICKANGLLDKY